MPCAGLCLFGRAISCDLQLASRSAILRLHPIVDFAFEKGDAVSPNRIGLRKLPARIKRHKMRRAIGDALEGLRGSSMLSSFMLASALCSICVCNMASTVLTSEGAMRPQAVKKLLRGRDNPRYRLDLCFSGCSGGACQVGPNLPAPTLFRVLDRVTASSPTSPHRGPNVLLVLNPDHITVLFDMFDVCVRVVDCRQALI